VSDSIDLFDPVPDTDEVEDIFASAGTFPGNPALPVNPNPVIVARYRVFLLDGRAVSFVGTGVWAEAVPF
jgi:hypothetical protein